MKDRKLLFTSDEGRKHRNLAPHAQIESSVQRYGSFVRTHVHSSVYVLCTKMNKKKESEFAYTGAAIDAVRNLAVASVPTYWALSRCGSFKISKCCVSL